MFSFIRTFFSVVFIVVVAACFVVWHYRVTATSYILSTLLNNPVTIGDADISLSLSRINGKNVGIVNPPRSRGAQKYAIKTRVFEFKTPLINWFKKTFVIEEINLDRVDFFVDMYNVVGSNSNIKTIIGNTKARAEERNPDRKKHKRPVIINKIILQDIKFSYRNPVLTPGLSDLAPVNKIEIHNVGSKHPVSFGQIFSIITMTMMKHFASLSGLKKAVENLPKLPIHWFENIFIKHGTADLMSLETYLDVPRDLNEKKAGFFKKIFITNRRAEEELD